MKKKIELSETLGGIPDKIANYKIPKRPDLGAYGVRVTHGGDGDITRLFKDPDIKGSAS